VEWTTLRTHTHTHTGMSQHAVRVHYSRAAINYTRMYNICRNYLVSSKNSGPHVTGDLTRWKRCNLWSAPTSQGVNVARGHRCAWGHSSLTLSPDIARYATARPDNPQGLPSAASRNGLAFIVWLSLLWDVTPVGWTRNLYQKSSPLKMETTVFP
jgi:hypothetical protein